CGAEGTGQAEERARSGPCRDEGDRRRIEGVGRAATALARHSPCGKDRSGTQALSRRRGTARNPLPRSLGRDGCGAEGTGRAEELARAQSFQLRVLPFKGQAASGLAGDGRGAEGTGRVEELALVAS